MGRGGHLEVEGAGHGALLPREASSHLDHVRGVHERAAVDHVEGRVLRHGHHERRGRLSPEGRKGQAFESVRGVGWRIMTWGWCGAGEP